jgi:hypothetical protein
LERFLHTNRFPLRWKTLSQDRFRERENTPAGQMQHHLVVPQSFATFDQTEIPDQAIVAAAHPS